MKPIKLDTLKEITVYLANARRCLMLPHLAGIETDILDALNQCAMAMLRAGGRLPPFPNASEYIATLQRYVHNVFGAGTPKPLTEITKEVAKIVASIEAQKELSSAIFHVATVFETEMFYRHAINMVAN